MALTDRDRRALIILGVAAGAALVAFVLMNLLGGGGGEEAAEPPPAEATAPPAAPSPEASPAPTPRETLPPVALVGARDPFSIPPALRSPSPGGGVSPTPTPTTSPTLPPTDGASITIGGHDVRLLSIFDDETKVQVEVDGTVYTVEEGETFDDEFELASILSDTCARFTWDGDSFELCLSDLK